MSSKLHFSQWKIHFFQFIFIDKYVKFKKIVYLTHDVKFKMCPALFYVNSRPYFQQWNSNWDIYFLNSLLHSKLRFLNVGLRLCSELFPNSQKDWKLEFLNVALVGLLNFLIHERDGKLAFLYISLSCTFKFLPIRWGVGKLGFLNCPYFQIFPDCEGRFSGMVGVWEPLSVWGHFMMKLPVFK